MKAVAATGVGLMVLLLGPLLGVASIAGVIAEDDDDAGCHEVEHDGDCVPLGPVVVFDGDLQAVLDWAASRAGDAYVFGASGPTSWDCSSFTQAAYQRAGITLPRTAQAQRDWLAAGNGTRIPVGQEQPGDLIFWDSYRGPNYVGHVAMIWDPATNTTIEARGRSQGVGHFTYTPAGKTIYEVWRVIVPEDG